MCSVHGDLNHSEIILLAGFSMYGEEHFIDRLPNRRFIANLPGVKKPVVFKLKRDAVAYVWREAHTLIDRKYATMS